MRDRKDLSDEEYDAYRAKQTMLDKCGVTDVAAVAISTHPAGIEGNMADTAIELLMELLRSGNRAVQDSVYTYIENDKDGKFVGHFRARMKHSTYVESTVAISRQNVLLHLVPRIILLL